MKVLFLITKKDYLTPRKPLESQMHINMGISYISSLLKQHGHDTDIFVVTEETKKREIYSYIKKEKPGLICFSAIASEYDSILSIADYIKLRFKKTYLLVGGPHATLVPEEIIKGPFDAVCIGEGEYPTLELVESLASGKSPENIKNLWIKTKKGIQKNHTRPFISDLDNLPFPDREMWQKWIYKKDSRHSVLIGRGCPFECSFCSNHILKKVSAGDYVRFRTPENIILELEQLTKNFPQAKEIFFEADTIGADIKTAVVLCGKLVEFNKIKKLSYIINLRISPGVDYDLLFSSFKKANFLTVNIGLESGNERIRKKILNRHYTNAEFLRVAGLAKRYGIKINLYAMIGLPTETLREFKDTVNICRACQPDYIYLGFFYPYPGTRLYEYCKKEDIIMPLKRDIERSLPSLRLEGFTLNQMKHEYIWFYFNVYSGKKSLFYILKYMLRKKIYHHKGLIRLSRFIFDKLHPRNRLKNYVLRESGIDH